MKIFIKHIANIQYPLAFREDPFLSHVAPSPGREPSPPGGSAFRSPPSLISLFPSPNFYDTVNSSKAKQCLKTPEGWVTAPIQLFGSHLSSFCAQENLWQGGFRGRPEKHVPISVQRQQHPSPCHSRPISGNDGSNASGLRWASRL